MRLGGRGRMSLGGAALAAALVFCALAALLPATAGAHSERATFFPDPNLGDFPQFRTTGPRYVVCRPDSQKQIDTKVSDPRVKQVDTALVKSCQSYTIQQAVRD